MLDRIPNKRIIAHEVVCHPRIVDDKFSLDEPLDSAIESCFKQFYAMNKLKKMALRVSGEDVVENESKQISPYSKTTMRKSVYTNLSY
ncbi:Calcium-dependent protein kinase SK5 [Artemisia annua]|uniref:Calcium-dependent protein kinase SK5 n=1 Tax=Artemisia annua TaxID=35608 RepID=A0A2U1KF02_ARTAN|nr:Calcium-dependent protein kinase SK5 [Artemisia annua]